MPVSALPRQIARLIEVAPVRPIAIVTAFETLATVIQERKRCDRVTALQMAIHDYPMAYKRYCRAVGGLEIPAETKPKA